MDMEMVIALLIGAAIGYYGYSHFIMSGGKVA